jgi:hypothetical protein
MPTRLDLVRAHETLITSIEEKVGPGNSPGVVILDTLNRSLNGSESKDVDMAAYINAADAMRERFNCLVVIIHHCGVDGTRPHGAEGEILVSTLAVVELGLDDDGDKITSCVIRPSDKPPAGSNGPRLSDQTAIALNLLRRALEDAGEKAPASNHIPLGTKVVRETLWREYYYNGTGQGLHKETDKGSRQKAFVRAKQKLQNIKQIGIWGEWVWTTDRTGRT